MLTAAATALAMLAFGGGPRDIQTALAASRDRPVSEHVLQLQNGVPATTSSFYVYGSFIDVCGLAATTRCPLYADAAAEPVPPAGGMTILDFGAPCFEPATLAWGTQLFNSKGCTPDATIVVLAGAWLRGYASHPNRSTSSRYVLAAGTSNSLTAADPGNALTGPDMALHADAWFTSVITPITAIAQSLTSEVTIWAGDDIEQSSDGNWYDGATTSAWVDAYAAASGASKPCVPSQSALLADYGDYVPNQPGWSPADVYHVSWQAAPVCPMPEIYNATNATEWESVNRYALDSGLPQLQFIGVLSEDGADGSLSSSGSWNMLMKATGEAAPYVSVIGVTGPIPPVVPDAPTVVKVVPGPGAVTLVWSAPVWDGGAAVTTYNVTAYVGSILAQELTFSGFPAPETAVIPGLSFGTPYTFYVSASNQAGTGPRSLPSRSMAPNTLFGLRPA